MRRFIVLGHRYLGIAMGLLFVLWFASGFVIIYTGGMPTLTEAERLAQLPALDLASVRIAPSEARDTSGGIGLPKLTTIMGRPAYRFSGRQGGVVFADNGQVLDGRVLSSRQIVANFTGAADDLIERVGRIEEVDQWTIGLRAELPLEKFRLLDKAKTEVYVSPIWGQVILLTTRSDRLLAWLGAIPHWLYFVELRKDTALWTQVVVWLSVLGSILAALGLIMIFTQLRRIRPFRLAEAIPYRGVMRWHYLCGMTFGIFALTWVFSGLLSMEPWQWTRPGGLAIPRDALQGGAIELNSFDRLSDAPVQQGLLATVASGSLKEIEFRRVGEEHFYKLTVSDASSHWGHGKRLVDAGSLTSRRSLFEAESISRRLANFAGDYAIVASEVLQHYDAYYYGRPSEVAPSPPLPVLRIKFDDPQATWLYADLSGGELVARVHRWGRLDRWLYNGLHSLDFSIWYGRRPLWDIVVLFLLGGGLVLVAFGTYLGWRRLFRNVTGWLDEN